MRLIMFSSLPGRGTEGAHSQAWTPGLELLPRALGVEVDTHSDPGSAWSGQQHCVVPHHQTLCAELPLQRGPAAPRHHASGHRNWRVSQDFH